MAGCVVSDLTKTLKSGKGLVTEVIQDGNIHYGRSDHRGFKRLIPHIRLFKDNSQKVSSQSYSSRGSGCATLADGAYKQSRQGTPLKEVVISLINRVYQGTAIDSYTYADVLQRCLTEKDLESVKQVHDCIKRSGLEHNPYVASGLLKCYIGCGRLQVAEELFSKLSTKNVVIWNIMMGAYAECDQAEDAMNIYKQMRHEGERPNAVTYLIALKACASPVALKWGKDIHVHIIHDGLEADVRVGTALVRMYSKCGSIEEAKAVFDKLEGRNIISWNVMIGGLAQHGLGHEAFSLFLQMQREGFVPDSITYLSILKPYTRTCAGEWVKEVHAHAMKAGLDNDLSVGNALVHMYCQSGNIEDARSVFWRMNKRDVISWNMMIGGLAEHGLGLEAFSLFLQMQREGVLPNSVTYLSILNPCSSRNALEWVKEIHVHAMKVGLDDDVSLCNALIHMYSKSGSIEDAIAVFGGMETRDVISWNTVIGGLAEHGLGHEAFSLFLQMQTEGFVPDPITYVSILHPCSSTGALEWIKKVHDHAVKAGLEGNLRVVNALVHMYAKSDSIEDAKVVFGRMERRDVISWNVMIGGVAERGLGHEAFSLLLEMQKQGFTPDSITFLSILNPCSRACSLEWVREVHSLARKAGVDLDASVRGALVHMYSKSGSIEDARQVFDSTLDRNIICWTAMIGGLAQHGHGREALQLFEEMKFIGVKPDGPLFVAVLSACNHAGLVDEGRFQFVSMTRHFGIEPLLEHYNCMVDILARAGHLEEANLFILNMPLKPVIITWGTLFGACRIYNITRLAELAAKEYIKLEPRDPSPYVLLSNVYAALGEWDQVASIRNMMQERGIRKDPGLCWMEVGDKVHEFVAGDTTHPESREIYAMLNCLFEELKGEAYIPDTRLVMRNVDKDEKESAVSSHSEKLAIAYGLMHVAPRRPIRIYKNLRICTDCHKATKLISKVTGREIVARDANRFHHFKDGLCSCGDYW